MAAVGDCYSSGTDGSAGQTALLDRPPLATAPVSADASFPSLLFTDVFCEGLPKQVRGCNQQQYDQFSPLPQTLPVFSIGKGSGPCTCSAYDA